MHKRAKAIKGSGRSFDPFMWPGHRMVVIECSIGFGCNCPTIVLHPIGARAPLLFQIEQALHVGFLHGCAGRRQLFCAELLDLSFAADEFFCCADHGHRAASFNGECLHALRRIGGLRFQKRCVEVHQAIVA